MITISFINRLAASKKKTILMITKNSLPYKLIAATGLKLIAAVEGIIRKNSIRGDFLPLERFSWVPEVESFFPEILAELRPLLADRSLPDFSKLSEEQQRIVQPEKWRSFVFCAYGNYVEKNCRQCPATYKAIQRIPGMVTAMFSVFEPGAHLIPHRGVYNGVLRYHLGLVVPQNTESCGLRLNGETHHWQAGKSMIFDDTREHEAWNSSSESRVILFVDFERPLPLWLKPFNHLMIRLIGASPLVKNILTNISRNDK